MSWRMCTREKSEKWQKRSWVSLLMVIQWFSLELLDQVLKCWISGWELQWWAESPGPWRWFCAAELAGGLWPISGVTQEVRQGWVSRAVQGPSCCKLMTICYKKGSRGGIQSDSLHSGSSHQLRAFFLMKVCFSTVNDLWPGLKCIALTMPTHFEHSK